MRIYLKRKLFALINSMEKGEELTRRYYDRGERIKAERLLEEIQHSALAAGQRIENCEGEGTRAVGLLEEYCELLWECAQAETAQARLKLYKRIRQKRIQAENSIRSDLSEEKLEIVFLPYKADMWTSLSSIWAAALQDEGSRVFVVPIPYYDIGNPENVTLIYEGGRFPEEVAITDYREYSLEERHPDMIFIHNPYDDWNNLTRVPSRYYSTHLKEHSELLIYSPYFTIGTYVPGKQDFIFQVPGARQADSIVVQSRRVKKLFQSYGYDPQKIIDYGSPKIDRIVEGNKGAVKLPETWREKIRGRKVFLLNTHLLYFPKSFANQSPAGNYGVRFHQEILEAFIGRDDCVLIWRPHPLLKNRLEGCFPQCLEYVNYFEKQVEEADNGIVDRLGDYFVSFSCSDALISTWSSLINEYMVTGKPVLIFQRRMKKEVELAAPLNRNTNYFRFGSGGLTFSAFRNQVLEGKDPMREERRRAVREAFPNLDGAAGARIFRHLKIAYEKRGMDLCRR